MRTEIPPALNAAAVGAPPRLPIAVLAMHNPVSKGKAVVPAKAGTQQRHWVPACAGMTKNVS